MAKKLNKLDIFSVFDLLYHIPFRYEDRSLIKHISDLKIGDQVTIIGRLDSLKNDYTKKGRVIQTGTISDSTGVIKILWFHQPFLTRTLTIGSEIALFGKVEFYGHNKALISPDYELITNHELLHMGRIISVYPETAGISSKYLRTKIFQLLSSLSLNDFLPTGTHPISWQDAIREIHIPSRIYDLASNIYKNRLAFDELLIAQLVSLSRKALWKKTVLTHPFTIPTQQVQDFISTLPFTLTTSQLQVLTEITSDLQKTTPMNRLLEGDVGSGKTVIAAIAALISHLNSFQTVILAPTQILAQQHYDTLSSLFNQLNIKIGLVTSQKKLAISNTQYAIIVGTHALLSKHLDFDRVGLVVIDEQHRFGVTQRALATQLGKSPHVLTMTATPIPRTVALTLYGDLDLSVLSQIPKGRKMVKTWVVPETKRIPSYTWITNQLTTNSSQAFWVCPFITESESAATIKSATTEFNHLKSIFKDQKLGLLHGKLKPKEKDAIMQQFKEHQLDILVCTPIVEVGIDIPNANIMIIEAAERFGLSQLHQLRGRVGRGQFQSYCLLFSETPNMRLKAMENHYSGLDLAEIDLKLRGPGQIYGISQHGASALKIADYSDIEAIARAQNASDKLFPILSQLPVLRSLVDQGKIDSVLPN